MLLTAAFVEVSAWLDQGDSCQNPGVAFAGGRSASAEARPSNNAAAEHRPLLQPGLLALPCGELAAAQGNDGQGNGAGMSAAAGRRQRHCPHSGPHGRRTRTEPTIQVSTLSIAACLQTHLASFGRISA